MAEPTLESVDELTFKLSWTLPTNDGGCPLTGFRLYRDEGDGSDIDEEIDSGIVPNDPSLFEYTVTLAGTFTGKTIRVKVKAETA